tara:strand:+ start:994 stop:1287 length:294 start_codon:yes stop_codon:yes gene_type:complete
MKTQAEHNRDGGPAFPINAIDWRDIPNHPAPGMTLRDWFAGQVIASGVLENENGTIESAAKELGIPIADYDCKIHWPLLVAKYAYQRADAMIAERNK